MDGYKNEQILRNDTGGSRLQTECVHTYPIAV